jgi:hypothetical protein
MVVVVVEVAGVVDDVVVILVVDVVDAIEVDVVVFSVVVDCIVEVAGSFCALFPTHPPNKNMSKAAGTSQRNNSAM